MDGAGIPAAGLPRYEKTPAGETLLLDSLTKRKGAALLLSPVRCPVASHHEKDQSPDPLRSPGSGRAASLCASLDSRAAPPRYPIGALTTVMEGATLRAWGRARGVMRRWTRRRGSAACRITGPA